VYDRFFRINPDNAEENDLDLKILLQCFDFRKLILPRINMKEADFKFISQKFKSISELDLDLLNQSSLLVDVELP
jgi:hypothetical protein